MGNKLAKEQQQQKEEKAKQDAAAAAGKVDKGVFSNLSFLTLFIILTCYRILLTNTPSDFGKKDTTPVSKAAPAAAVQGDYSHFSNKLAITDFDLLKVTLYPSL